MKDLNDDVQIDADGTIEIADAARLSKTPAVSVVMLAYQHEKFIEQAIRGVIAQECNFSIELIIGEDCSLDGTRQIVMNYQRRYPHIIRVLTAEKNVGMHANGDRCTKACRGEFIATCEGDDYWNNPKKLQMQVDLLRKHPEAFLIHTEYDIRVGNRILRNAHLWQQISHLAVGDAFTTLLIGNTVITATTMIRRSLLTLMTEANLQKNNWPFGDYPIWLYASMLGPVLYIPTSTATYRQVGGSATNQGRSAALRMHRAAIDCRESFLNLANSPEEIRNQVRAQSHMQICKYAVLIGDKNLYDTEYRWLKENGFASGKCRRLLDILLVSFPLLLKIHRTILSTYRKLAFLASSSTVRSEPFTNQRMKAR